MKNLIYQIFGKILTQVSHLEEFSVSSKSLALALTFPITLSTSLPISLTDLQSQNPKQEIVISEKLVEVAADFQNPIPLALVEKEIEIKLSESNFDKESALAKAMVDKQKMAKRNLITREKPRFSPDPGLEQKRALVVAAASKYGIDWRILEAVWQVESGKSWDTARRSYAGATGPMQFLPSTFRKYAPSSASIYSASDSVYAAANLLASSGASSGQVERALFAYNHSYSYVKKVLKVARELGY